MHPTGRQRFSRRRLLACGITALGTGLVGCSTPFESEETTTLRPTAEQNDDGEFALSYSHDGEQLAECVVSRGDVSGRDVRVVPFTCSLSRVPDRLRVSTLCCLLGTRWLGETDAAPPQLALSPHSGENWPPSHSRLRNPAGRRSRHRSPGCRTGRHSSGFRPYVRSPNPENSP